MTEAEPLCAGRGVSCRSTYLNMIAVVILVEAAGLVALEGFFGDFAVVLELVRDFFVIAMFVSPWWG